MTVTVFSKPACVQCDATYRALDKKGIEYNSVDISQDAEALAYVQAAGALAAPFVEAKFEDGSVRSWAGFKPEEIMALASA